MGKLTSQDLCTHALQGQGKLSSRERKGLAVGGWVRNTARVKAKGVRHQQLSVTTCIGIWKPEFTEVMILSN